MLKNQALIRHLRLEYIILASIFIFLFIRFILPAIGMYSHINTMMWFDDFKVYHFAAQNILNGEIPLSKIYQSSYAGDGHLTYKYSPVWLILFLPFGLLPVALATIIWLGLMALCITLSFWLAGKILNYYHISYSPLFYLVTLLFLYRPITEEYRFGQTDSVLLFLILLSLYFYIQTHKKLLSFLLLAIAISLKPPAMIFFLLFFMRKDYKALLWTTFLFLLSNITSCFLLSPTTHIKLLGDWIYALHASGSSLLFDIDEHSLFSLLGRYLSEDVYRINILSLSKPFVIKLTLFLGGLLVALTFVLREYYPASKDFDLFMINFCILFMLFFSPNTWLANHSMLILPVLLAITSLKIILPHFRFFLFPPLMMWITAYAFTHKKTWRIIGHATHQGEQYVTTIFKVWSLFSLTLFILLIGLFIALQQRSSRHLSS